MAPASPSAMERLRATIETSVVKLIARNTAIDPKIAIPPTANGSAAATRPPNTQTNTRKLSGIATASMTFKSFSLCRII